VLQVIPAFQVTVLLVTAGNGGSGVVIIAYPTSNLAAASTTGSPTITTSGSYRLYIFTSSGSITI